MSRGGRSSMRRSLRRVDHRWTAWTIAHELPLLATAAGLVVLSPILIPVSLAALAFAWFIPDLYAAKGAEVLRPPRERRAHHVKPARRCARSGCWAHAGR